MFFLDDMGIAAKNLLYRIYIMQIKYLSCAYLYVLTYAFRVQFVENANVQKRVVSELF